MSHRDEAPQDKCPACGAELQWLAGKPAHAANRYCPECHRDEAPRQKLTGDSARETPRTDKYRNTRLLNFYSVEPHDIAFMRELERELNAKSRELYDAQQLTAEWTIKVCRLERELEEARKDAARYRWLRENDDATAWAIMHTGTELDSLCDEAIDSALHHDGK